MFRAAFGFLLGVLASAAVAAPPELTFGAGLAQSQLGLHGLAGGGGDVHVTPLREGLGYDRARQTGAWLAVMHDASPWPQLRLAHAGYQESAQRLQPPSRPGAPSFLTTTALRIESSDVTFYWTPAQGPWQLDLGVALHRLRVDFAIDVRMNGRPIQAVQAHQLQWFPAVYAATRGGLTRHWYAFGTMVGSTYKGRNLLQAQAGLGWSPWEWLGIELGYEQQILKFDSRNIAVDMRASGPYAGLRFRW